MDRRRVLGWVRRYGLLTVMLTVLALRRITIKKRLRAKLKQVKAELRRRVLVRLTPAAYQRFLRQAFPATPMHMICESSPIIRATTVALFQRMNHSRLAQRYQRRGGNLFLPLGGASH